MLAVTDSAWSSCLEARSTAACAPSTAACARWRSTSPRSRSSATSLADSDRNRPSRRSTTTPTHTSSAQKTAAISAASSATFMTGPSASWLLLCRLLFPWREDGPDPPGAFRDARLQAMLGRLVVGAVRHRVRSVTLRDDAVVEVVRVSVAFTVPDLARPRIVRVAQVRGHSAKQAGPDVGVGRADRLDDRVGLGRQRDMDHGLRQVDPGLGQPDELYRLRGGDGGL